MRQRRVQTHSWLFAFVDLAFLLLIVVTHIGDSATTEDVDLGEIVIPKLQQAAADDLPGYARELWQLRVLRPAANDSGRFELIPANDASQGRASGRTSLVDLHTRLDAIRESGSDKPLLVPDRKSESQDLLDAVAALEARWPNWRRAATAQLASN